MVKIIFSILFTTLLLFADSATSCKVQNSSIEKQQISKDTKADEVKQRGCCSWHGGVSGCSNGRIVCNDGSYSPSCTCAVPVDPLG